MIKVYIPSNVLVMPIHNLIGEISPSAGHLYAKRRKIQAA